MRGLFLSCFGKKEEAYASVRLGIKSQMRSHICKRQPFYLGWHVYGLLYRADKNYEEAMKCYRNALKYDRENFQILRDLAILQLQMRNLEGHTETRYTLLALKPNIRVSWIALAVSYHLQNKHAQAIAILDAYLESCSESAKTSRAVVANNETAEIHLYKNLILREMGSFEAAFSHIDSLDICAGDQTEFKFQRASLLARLERHGEAQGVVEELLNENPNRKEFLELVKTIYNELHYDLTKLLYSLMKRHPRSWPIKQFHLMNSKDFAADLFKLVAEIIDQRIPSGFKLVERVYENQEQREIMCSLVDDLLASSSDDDPKAFWTCYFVAQHFFKLGKNEEALQTLDRAYSIQKDVPDLYLFFAKLFSKNGMSNYASRCAEMARKMETSDRYVNSEFAKYLFRDGQIDRASEVVCQFIKKADFESQMQDLVDMQSQWFFVEMGRAYFVLRNYQKALSVYDNIFRFYQDFFDDQFDFHNYTLRRMTLVSYIDLLRHEDTIWSHPMFAKAAEGAVESVLALESSEVSLEDLTLAESKNRGIKWVEKLEQYHSQNARTFELAFDIYYHQSRMRF